MIGLGYENKKLYGMGNIGSNFEAGSWSPAFHGAIRAYLPIYSGGRISARVDSATADYNKMIYKEKEILTDIKNQVRDNYRTLEEMKRQIEISELIIKMLRDTSYLLRGVMKMVQGLYLNCRMLI